MQEHRSEISLEELRQSSDGRFDALLEAIVDAIIVINADGVIEEFSAAATRMFGYEREQVIGQNVSILMPEPYRSNHDDYIANYVRSGDAKIIGLGREVKGLRKDGTIFPIELAVGEVKDNVAPKFVGIIRDISDRKAAELEAREQRERLAHVTRLSTMGEMAAGIAHEVNQPLTAITTYANAGERILGAKAPDLESLRSILSKLSAQALRAGEVIRRLRSFVSKREGQYEVLPINAIANETVILAEVDSRHHDVQLRLEPSPDSPRVLVDAIQIQQVILNLIRNAIEAVASAEGANRCVTIRVSELTDTARVEIIDQGAGLAAGVYKNLFMPFQTTKDSGMGMGLSISRSIVEAHQGSLSYRKNPSGGAIFYFDLPLAERG